MACAMLATDHRRERCRWKESNLHGLSRRAGYNRLGPPMPSTYVHVSQTRAAASGRALRERHSINEAATNSQRCPVVVASTRLPFESEHTSVRRPRRTASTVVCHASRDGGYEDCLARISSHHALPISGHTFPVPLRLRMDTRVAVESDARRPSASQALVRPVARHPPAPSPRTQETTKAASGVPGGLRIRRIDAC